MKIVLSGVIAARVAVIVDLPEFSVLQWFHCVFAESVDGLFCHTNFSILRVKQT